MEQAVYTYSAQYGTLFVISAGNSGPTAGSVRSPSTARAALSVAPAVDRQDRTAFMIPVWAQAPDLNPGTPGTLNG